MRKSNPIAENKVSKAFSPDTPLNMTRKELDEWYNNWGLERPTLWTRFRDWVKLKWNPPEPYVPEMKHGSPTSNFKFKYNPEVKHDPVPKEKHYHRESGEYSYWREK